MGALLRRSVIGLSFAASMIAIAASAQKPADPPAEAEEIKVPFTRFTLSNGLVVLVHEDHRVPLVAVSLWYGVGGRDDVQGKTGFAHLFEHMMFEPSAHLQGGKTFNGEMGSIGAKDVNATTTMERTEFHEVVPSNRLETVLWLESDRMGFLEPSLSARRFETQREIVNAERRQRFDDVPLSRENAALRAALYPQGSPWRAGTIGSRKDLDAASLDDVRLFFRRWYTPSNCTLAVAGDVSADEVRRLVEKWFGSLPGGARPARAAVSFPPLEKKVRTEVEDPFSRLRHVVFAWVSPGFLETDDAELDIAANLLAAKAIGRLSRKLVIDRRLAVSLAARQNSSDHEFRISVTLKPGAKLEDVEAEVLQAVAALRKTRVGDDEIRRAALAFESAFVWGLDGLLPRAESLQVYEHFRGDPGFLPQDVARYRAATPASVQSAVSRWLGADAYAEVVSNPKKTGAGTEEEPDEPAVPATEMHTASEAIRPEVSTSAATAAAAAAAATSAGGFSRLAPPPAPEARPFVVPRVQTFTLSNGVVVHLVENHELPVVQLHLLLRGGTEDDAIGKEGEGAICMGLLSGRSPAMDGPAFRTAQADLAAVIASGAGPESSYVTLSALRRNLDPSLDLFADIVRKPTVDDGDLKREVSNRLDLLRQVSGTPLYVGQRIVPRLAFGPDHPHGRLETLQSAQDISGDDCRRRLERSVRPRGAELFVQGDLTVAQLRERMEVRLGGWTGGAEVAPPPSRLEPVPGRIFLHDIPGAAQSVIYAFEYGPERSAPDYEATWFAERMLGGINGLLFQDLRQRHAYAYSVNANIAYYRSGSLFIAAASVKRDATSAAIERIVADVEFLAMRGPGAQWVDAFKEHDLVAIPAQFADRRTTLLTLERLGYYGRPFDEPQHLREQLATLKAEDVRAAAQKHIDVRRMKYLVIGDAKAVAPSLDKLLRTGELGPGALVRVDEQGKPLP